MKTFPRTSREPLPWKFYSSPQAIYGHGSRESKSLPGATFCGISRGCKGFFPCIPAWLDLDGPCFFSLIEFHRWCRFQFPDMFSLPGKADPVWGLQRRSQCSFPWTSREPIPREFYSSPQVICGHGSRESESLPGVTFYDCGDSMGYDVCYEPFFISGMLGLLSRRTWISFVKYDDVCKNRAVICWWITDFE